MLRLIIVIVITVFICKACNELVLAEQADHADHPDTKRLQDVDTVVSQLTREEFRHA